MYKTDQEALVIFYARLQNVQKYKKSVSKFFSLLLADTGHIDAELYDGVEDPESSGGTVPGRINH